MKLRHHEKTYRDTGENMHISTLTIHEAPTLSRLMLLIFYAFFFLKKKKEDEEE